MKNLPTNSEIAPALGDPTISVTLSTWRWSGVITIVSSAICKPALPSLLKIKQTQPSIQSYYYDDEFNAEEDKTVPCSCVGCSILCMTDSWSRNWGNHFVTNKLFNKPVVVSTHAARWGNTCIIMLLFCKMFSLKDYLLGAKKC